MGSKDPSEKARVWRPKFKFKALLCCPRSSSATATPPPPPPQDSACSSTHQSNRRVYKHDVFLSFRGTDTGNNFTIISIIISSGKEFSPSGTTRGFRKGNLSLLSFCKPSEIPVFLSLSSHVIMLPPHGASMKWLP